MAYTMAGVPVGSYELGRLSNLGTNHWSLDAGGGYTYLDAKKGHEFSAVLGFTYNWENNDTDYKSGTSAHLDWAASQILSEQCTPAWPATSTTRWRRQWGRRGAG